MNEFIQVEILSFGYSIVNSEVLPAVQAQILRFSGYTGILKDKITYIMIKRLLHQYVPTLEGKEKHRLKTKDES